MVRPMPMIIQAPYNIQSFSTIPFGIALFVSATLLVAVCAKHATKYASKTRNPSPNKGSLPSTKQFITTISQKAMTPLHHHAKKSSSGQESGGCPKGSKEESGLWQKAILMGEKCQPPEFSGVIYYDYSGNRISEMPRSPRAGSMSPLRNFTFPLPKNEIPVC